MDLRFSIQVYNLSITKLFFICNNSVFHRSVKIKKTRGIFGEVNLKHILSSVFGEKNDNVYKLQCQLPNGTIADSILFAPEPLGTIAIDSKFPLENYQLMVDKNNNLRERQKYEKQFKIDVKSV